MPRRRGRVVGVAMRCCCCRQNLWGPNLEWKTVVKPPAAAASFQTFPLSAPPPAEFPKAGHQQQGFFQPRRAEARASSGAAQRGPHIAPQPPPHPPQLLLLLRSRPPLLPAALARPRAEPRRHVRCARSGPSRPEMPSGRLASHLGAPPLLSGRRLDQLCCVAGEGGGGGGACACRVGPSTSELTRLCSRTRSPASLPSPVNPFLDQRGEMSSRTSLVSLSAAALRPHFPANPGPRGQGELLAADGLPHRLAVARFPRGDAVPCRNRPVRRPTTASFNYATTIDTLLAARHGAPACDPRSNAAQFPRKPQPHCLLSPFPPPAPAPHTQASAVPL